MGACVAKDATHWSFLALLRMQKLRTDFFPAIYTADNRAINPSLAQAEDFTMQGMKGS